jgi:class 3 adenylate cyclase
MFCFLQSSFKGEFIIRRDFLLWQKQKNETLRTSQFLSSMLPDVVVMEIKSGNMHIAHDREASVMFSDIVSFTSIAASRSPEDVVALTQHHVQSL